MRNKLSDKQYKDYMRTSRYSSFPYYFIKTDNKYSYGITSHIKKNNITYVGHKVIQGDTLDTLALYYYNNPTYFWIIADFNNIRDPYAALKIGTIIKIPTFSKIEFEV